MERYRYLLATNPEAVGAHLIRTELPEHAGLIARWLMGKSVGMALGGGGARGMAHIGILQVLEHEGVVVDAVAGSSAGTIMAGIASIGLCTDEMADLVDRHLIRSRSHPFSAYALPLISSSLLSNKRARKQLRKFFGNMHCAQTRIAFFPVCTNMLDGTETVVRDLPIREAILASGAAPGLFPLIEHNGRILADGGMVNNVPASVLKRYGCEFVISSNISIDPAKTTFNPRSMTRTILHALDILMDHSLKEYLGYTNFEIKPAVDAFGVLDFKAGKKIMEIGRQTITKRLPELKRQLARAGIQLRPPKSKR